MESEQWRLREGGESEPESLRVAPCPACFVETSAGPAGSREPTRVCPEWTGAEAGPLSPNIGPGALGPGVGRPCGRQLGVSPVLTVRGGSPSSAPAVPPSPRVPGATQGHSWLPRRAHGAARVAFKISLTNQIWLFQEAPSLAVPLAGRVQGGRDLYIPGSLAKYPLWPKQ